MARIKIYGVLGIIGLSLMVTALVYSTGGIQYAYAHSMYVPVVLAAVLYGLKLGIAMSVIGGLLLGPFMPIDVTNQIMQEPTNWMVRMFFFVLIAVVTGMAVERLKDFYRRRLEYHSHLPDSRIPLITRLFDKYESMDKHAKEQSAVLYVYVSNYVRLVDLIGHQDYVNILGLVYEKLMDHIPYQVSVYSKDLQSLVILLEDKTKLKEVLELTEKLLFPSFLLREIPIHFETVIGSSAHHKNIYETLRRSIKTARNAEKHSFSSQIYDDIDDGSDMDMIYLGTVLDGLDNHEFYLVFQPLFDLETKEIVSAEALLRWNHNTLGSVPPSNFIPIIEETSLINPITEWVVKKALETINALRSKNIDITIAVNISTKNLYRKDFFSSLNTWIDEYGLSSKDIELEITESSLMQNPDTSLKTLHELNEIGMSISLDDFGTGYSSLAYLNKLPVQKIKIDRAFVAELALDHKTNTISDYAIRLAKNLNIATVAEGVETEEQLNVLKMLGCNYVQGYHLSEPLSYKALVELIEGT